MIVFARGDVAGPLFKVSDAGGIATPATIHAVGERQHIRRPFCRTVAGSSTASATADCISRRSTHPRER